MIPLALFDIPLNLFVRLKYKGVVWYVYLTQTPGVEVEFIEIDYNLIRFKAWEVYCNGECIGSVIRSVKGVQHYSNYLLATSNQYLSYSIEDILTAKIPAQHMFRFKHFNMYDYRGMCTLLVLHPTTGFKDKLLKAT